MVGHTLGHTRKQRGMDVMAKMTGVQGGNLLAKAGLAICPLQVKNIAESVGKGGPISFWRRERRATLRLRSNRRVVQWGAYQLLR